jgi:hypothetical protein
MPTANNTGVIVFGGATFLVVSTNSNAPGNCITLDIVPNLEYLPANTVYLQSSYPELFSVLGILYNSLTTQRALPVSANWIAATYGRSTSNAGSFVAIAYGSAIAATSQDGSAWVQRALPVSANWAAIAYGAGVFVAVASGSAIAATSTNLGASWTQRTLPTTTTWKSVTYGNGTFVAIAQDSTIAATSTDGITWVQRTLPTPVYSWTQVIFGNGLFVAIAYGVPLYLTSPDGITWTQRTISGTAGDTILSIAYGNGVFVVTCEYTDGVYYSSSGTGGWNRATMPVSDDWYTLAFGNGVFVAAVNGTAVAATSVDGATWLQRVLPVAAPWQVGAYGAGVFVELAYGTAIAATFLRVPYDVATQFVTPEVTVNVNTQAYIKAKVLS